MLPVFSSSSCERESAYRTSSIRSVRVTAVLRMWMAAIAEAARKIGGRRARANGSCKSAFPRTRSELDEAIKQAADYLEDELKAGRKPRRRYRFLPGTGP